MWHVLRDIVFAHDTWERFDILDDDVDFRTKDFDFPHGRLRVDLVFATDLAGFKKLESVHCLFGEEWGVQYARIDGETVSKYVRYRRRAGLLDKIQTYPINLREPPSPDMDLAQWVHFCALHPIFCELVRRSEVLAAQRLSCRDDPARVV